MEDDKESVQYFLGNGLELLSVLGATVLPPLPSLGAGTVRILIELKWISTVNDCLRTKYIRIFNGNTLYRRNGLLSLPVSPRWHWWRSVPTWPPCSPLISLLQKSFMKMQWKGRSIPMSDFKCVVIAGKSCLRTLKSPSAFPAAQTGQVLVRCMARCDLATCWYDLVAQLVSSFIITEKKKLLVLLS